MQTKNQQLGSNINWSGKHILLIDSDWLNQLLHRLHFEGPNPFIHCVNNYSEASAIFNTYPIDIILTEIYFINTEGQQFLKEVSEAFHKPVIIQTTQNIGTESLSELGFKHSGIFSKPIKWASYLQAIDRCIGSASSENRPLKANLMSARNISRSEFIK